LALTIVSLKSGTDVSRIELSDGSLFSFKDCYLSGAYIADNYVIGGEINADEEQDFRFASACLRAEKRALQLIARAEQTAFGLSRKLQKRGHDPDCIHAVIAQLCALNLLDDRRYARLWLESRISRQATSPRRLLAALRSRGIDRRDAEAALKETLDDEAERQLLERYVQKLRRKGIFSAGEVADSNGADSVPNPEGANSTILRSVRYTLRNEGFSSLAIEIVLDQ
jgi:regulatory protein